MPLTPEERQLRASLAAHEQWAREPDRTARTAKARRAFLAKLEAEVDPAGALPAAERARRAEHLRQAHMARMALAASRARSRRKKGGGDARAS
jgi:hypothetical protein